MCRNVFNIRFLSLRWRTISINMKSSWIPVGAMSNKYKIPQKHPKNSSRKKNTQLTILFNKWLLIGVMCVVMRMVHIQCTYWSINCWVLVCMCARTHYSYMHWAKRVLYLCDVCKRVLLSCIFLTTKKSLSSLYYGRHHYEIMTIRQYI